MKSTVEASEGKSEWKTLAAIAERVGPTFYLADVSRFAFNCERFLKAFRHQYPRSSLAYSYKANYLPGFIRSADASGAYSEVVSGFEYEIARELGIADERIIFNGPIKRDHELRQALEGGALVNADSLSEIHELASVSSCLPERVPVGIRCNLRSEGVSSRFGIDLRGPEAMEAIAAIDAAPKLRLAGLHFHVSGNRSADHYRACTRAMIRLHLEILGGRPLDFLDMGGGFAGPMSAELATKCNASSATFDDYAQAIGGVMADVYGAEGPELILEPGMAIAADAMVFTTRVEVIKMQHEPLAVVDGSRLFAQPPWNLHRRDISLPMRVHADPRGARRPVAAWRVVGPTCIENDTLVERYEGPLGIGDFLQFINVGAYTNVLGAPFIRGIPPTVSNQSGGAIEVLHPGSTARELVRRYGSGGHG